MTSVRVPLSDATDRRLPLTSVHSGHPADGYLGVPLGMGVVDRVVWGVTQRSADRPQAYLPLTEREFDRVMMLRRAEQSGLVNAVLFGLLALAFARFPLLLPLGLSICGVSLALHVAARVGLARTLPGATVDRGKVTLDPVHGEFAARVERGERRYT